MAAKAETIRLIRTKLNPPRVTDALVRRPRLIELLDTQPERPLTLVVASAGYGKTTLVSSWLQAQHYRNCWLSLDEYDNDLGTFLAYLTAAIRRAYPDSCRLTSDLLQGVSLPHTQTIASSLIDDLEILPQPLVLVLDDYHTIREPAINELFSVLLRYPPESLRLVLISRRDPLLPLARLRARGELAEVRARDLRFTRDEVAALVRLSPFADVDDAGVESLEEGTEGWITGLRLALLSRQREPDAGSQEEPLPSQGKYLADYLMSEMFADQPADIQDFLVRTSLFERFSAPLCETALGSDGPLGGFQSFLTSPSAANLFVVSLDMQDQWFRHHHLVQRFLQMQARTRLSACEISDLHERAAEWFSAEGLIDEALRHFLAAGDPDGAARLLVNQRHLLMSRGYWSGIVRYLTMLPDEVVEQEPELLIQKAWIKRIQWRSTSMQPDLARAEALLETSQLGESAQRSLRGEIDALNATPTLSDGSAQDAIPLLESAVKAIDPEHSYVRGYAMMLLANAYQLNGTADAAVALLMEAARDPLADTQLQLRLW
ncbi:MAG: hypothetical protein AB8I69_23600, partial [Anaerolineae bacterium]